MLAVSSSAFAIAFVYAAMSLSQPSTFATTRWPLGARPRVRRRSSHGSPLGPAEATLYERVLAENCRELQRRVTPGDLVICHDPQTAGLVPHLLSKNVTVIWRCHIGLDTENRATRAAWDFLAPYLDAYDHAVFSAPEYIPRRLAGRATVIAWR